MMDVDLKGALQTFNGLYTYFDYIFEFFSLKYPSIEKPPSVVSVVD